MATPVNYNGVSYSIPAFGDVGYAQGPGNLSSYLIALASGPQTTGGLFSLTAPLNFGPNFGIVAVNFTSTSANPATAGTIRLANADTIDWRNNANTGNLALGVNASDQLTFQGVALSTPTTNGTVSAGIAGRLTLYPAAGNTVDDVYVQNAFNIDILIAAQAARSVALEYSIPNPGNAVAAATFALLELAQTFTAIQTFAATVNITATTNQLVLGTTNTVTITSPAPAASRVYTIPDVLGAASFVMTAGAQSIAGVKTFTGGAGAITLSASTIAMGANKITGLANGTVTTDAAAFGQLKIIQTVTATSTTAFTTTSGTFVSANLTASITPTSASNKVLIMAMGTLQSTSLHVCYATILNGTSGNLGGTNGFVDSFITGGGGSGHVPSCIVYMDSPATTSARTYTVQIKNDDGVSTAGYGQANQVQFMLLMEVAP